MKRIFLLIATVIFLTSCEERTIIKEGECEYIKTISFTSNGGVSSLTHKGDCKNPIHHKTDTVYIKANKQIIK